MPKKLNISLIGGLLAGIATSLCCAGPLVLLSLGFSGAWVSNLAALTPYRPVFIVLAVAALIIAYSLIYNRAPDQVCEEGKVCAKPLVKRAYEGLFWSVAVVVLMFIASPYLISIIYG
ncbi:MAG: mercuric transporter MerT family protein [Methylobacter sp.]|nr:mercuric transporter MerT family protein [Methylobacter sp.]